MGCSGYGRRGERQQALTQTLVFTDVWELDLWHAGIHCDGVHCHTEGESPLQARASHGQPARSSP